MARAANMDLAILIGTVFFSIIGIIMIVAVGVPIISEYQVASTVANADAINSIINTLPIILVLMILVADAYAVMSFVKNR